MLHIARMTELETAPEGLSIAKSNRLCLKTNSHDSLLRELCDDPAAAEEEGEEGAGQDAGH